MGRSEQLVLDLGLQPRQPRRVSWWRPVHPVRALARLLVSLLVAVLLAGVAVSLVPYRSSIAGVGITVTGSVTPSHRGLSVDSTLGSLQFRYVTALPLGLHVAPDIDLDAVRAATDGGDAFSDRARDDLRARVPGLVARFGGAAVLGLLVGALVGGLLFDGTAQLVSAHGWLRGGSRRRRLTETATRVVGLTVATTVVVAGVTALTYRGDWYARYSVTGLLADVAATPDRLAALDARDAGAADKVRAALRLQDALTEPLSQRVAPSTAYGVMFISDVHRRNIYPYLQQYVDANDVRLIVNTGDETLVGNAAELTPDYVASIAAITARTPMVWVKGNHDSAAVAATMDAIPGVTVLDDQVLDALGLQVYGTADPRTYGAAGAAGSDDPATVTRVESQGAATALRTLDRSTYLDLLLAHEPVEADTMAETLGASVRAQASGHVHRQNAEGDLQAHGRIRLVEGSTGLGGLLADAGDPMEFSILSVAENCQYTRIVRYQLADPALPASSDASSFGDNSALSVHYFDAQPIVSTRTCAVADGIGDPVEADSTSPSTVQQWSLSGTPAPTDAAVVTPSPVTTADEAGDDAAVTSSSPTAQP